MKTRAEELRRLLENGYTIKQQGKEVVQINGRIYAVESTTLTNSETGESVYLWNHERKA